MLKKQVDEYNVKMFDANVVIQQLVKMKQTHKNESLRQRGIAIELKE